VSPSAPASTRRSVERSCSRTSELIEPFAQLAHFLEDPPAVPPCDVPLGERHAELLLRPAQLRLEVLGSTAVALRRLPELARLPVPDVPLLGQRVGVPP
jgi:hypothetical protein